MFKGQWKNYGTVETDVAKGLVNAMFAVGKLLFGILW